MRGATVAVSFCHHHKQRVNKSRVRVLVVLAVLLIFGTPPGVVVSSPPTTTTTTSQANYYRFADHLVVGNGDDDDSEETTDASRQPQSLLADSEPPVCDHELSAVKSCSWKRTDWYLATFWPAHAGFDNAHLQPQPQQEDDSSSSSSAAAALTYGEVTPLGGRQLAYEMGIAPRDCGNDNPDDGTTTTSSIVFYDLGSGTGRLVAQMHLDHPPHRVQTSVGIELAYDRHAIAKKAWEEGISQYSYSYHQEEDDEDACTSSDTSQDDSGGKHNHKDVKTKDTSSPMSCDTISVPIESYLSSSLSSLSSDTTAPIQYIHGDVLEVLDWKEEATHVSLSSLCFPKHVLQALQGHLLESGPQLETVAALNRLDQFVLAKDDWDERTIPIQMSWGPSTAKIYQRKRTTTIEVLLQ